MKSIHFLRVRHRQYGALHAFIGDDVAAALDVLEGLRKDNGGTLKVLAILPEQTQPFGPSGLEVKQVAIFYEVDHP